MTRGVSFGKIFATIVAICTLVIMFFVPTIIKNIDKFDNLVDNENTSIVINGVKFDTEDESDQKTIAKIKNVIETNSETKIIITSEMGLIAIIAYMIIIRIILKHLENLFKNVNEIDTPFTLENVNHIKKIAYYMIAAMIISAIGSGIFNSLIIEEFTLELKLFNIVEILFLISIAYIFEYGYEIQKDSKGRMYGDE